MLDYTIVHFNGIAAFQPVINGRQIFNLGLIYMWLKMYSAVSNAGFECFSPSSPTPADTDII